MRRIVLLLLALVVAAEKARERVSRRRAACEPRLPLPPAGSSMTVSSDKDDSWPGGTRKDRCEGREAGCGTSRSLRVDDASVAEFAWVRAVASI